MKMTALGREVCQYGPQAPIFEAGNSKPVILNEAPAE